MQVQLWGGSLQRWYAEHCAITVSISGTRYLIEAGSPGRGVVPFVAYLGCDDDVDKNLRDENDPGCRAEPSQAFVDSVKGRIFIPEKGVPSSEPFASSVSTGTFSSATISTPSSSCADSGLTCCGSGIVSTLHRFCSVGGASSSSSFSLSDRSNDLLKRCYPAQEMRESDSSSAIMYRTVEDPIGGFLYRDKRVRRKPTCSESDKILQFRDDWVWKFRYRKHPNIVPMRVFYPALEPAATEERL
ncbi:unnamed protein product [Amoebophrya sp. A25]|nr:unnamed protein product [Amoebophrya sp. A25]|eukprot:GSA25T00000798001.1